MKSLMILFKNNIILMTPENINIMLNDEKYPFGYSYCLTITLLAIKNIL